MPFDIIRIEGERGKRREDEEEKKENLD